MAGFINLPPNNLGDANVYSYLYQMAEQMNYALRNLESGTVRPNKDGTGTEIVYTSSDGTETAYDNETFNQLRALIIKTGDAVTNFSSSFTARVDGVEQDISNKLLGYATTSSVSDDIGKAIQNAVTQSGAYTDEKISTVNNEFTSVYGAISSNKTASDNEFDSVRSLIQTAQNTADNASTAAGNASQKADDAEANAKSYADGLKTDLEGAIDTAKNEAITAAEDSTTSTAYNAATSASDVAYDAHSKADQAMSQISSINLTLESYYGVTSDFGSYIEEIQSNLQIDSTGQTSTYTVIQGLKDISENIAGFNTWMNVSQQYIKSGYLYDDEDGRPVIGVAVGELLDVIAYEDSSGTSVIDQTDSVVACYTAKKVSYMQQGRELAYLGGSVGLGVNKAKIEGSLTFGGYQFEPQSDKGMILKWVGG